MSSDVPLSVKSIVSPSKMRISSRPSGRILLVSPVAVTLLFMLCLGSMFTVSAYAAGGGSQSDGASGPHDDNAVTPGQIRRNYGKRFPYSAEQAREDSVNNQESSEGSQQSFQAYTQVKQPCIGGYLQDLDALEDLLQQQDQQIEDAIQSRLDHDRSLTDAQRRCLTEQKALFEKQRQQLQGLDRTDLGNNLGGLNNLSDATWTCPDVAPPLMYAFAQDTLNRHNNMNPGLNQLKNMLNSVISSDTSLITDDKKCCFDVAQAPIGNFIDQKPLFAIMHYFYIQNNETATVNLPSQRDSEALQKGLIKTYGLPMSDTQFQLIDRNNKQRLLEMVFDPERWNWTQTASEQIQMSSLANSVGGAAEAGFKAAFSAINATLINVANERSGADGASSGGSGGNSHKSIPQAVQIVQKMYKFIFLPMALLFLLPGAVLTQVKGMVSHAFLSGGEDATSPFEGIVRAMIAVFLIPATQLIISYAVDIGNAMTDAVRDPAKHWIEETTLMNWAKEQTFNPSPMNVNNGMFLGNGNSSKESGSKNKNDITNGGSSSAEGQADTSGEASNDGNDSSSSSSSSSSQIIKIAKNLGISFERPSNSAFDRFLGWLFGREIKKYTTPQNVSPQGKSAGQLEEDVVQENQLWLSTTMQLVFNSASYLMGYALTVLTAYQLVFMCYLFLLGPIAACLFAWPSGIGSLFKNVFSNWLDAVVVLSLWRFYWCVILAMMTQRIVYLHPNPGSPSEMMVFDCFMALLLYVPFQPFNFKPGPIVSSLLDKAAHGGGGAGNGVSGGQPGVSHEGQGGAGGEHSTSISRRHGYATKSFSAVSSGQATGVSHDGSISGDSGQVSDVSAPPMVQQPRIPAGEIGSLSALTAPSTSPSQDVSSPSGQEVDASSPPVSQIGSVESDNPAVNALRSETGIHRIEDLSSGSYPSVALACQQQMPAVLLNTRNIDEARAGLKAWQKAAPELEFLQTGSPGTSVRAPGSSSQLASVPQPRPGSGANASVAGIASAAEISGGNKQGIGQSNLAAGSGVSISHDGTQSGQAIKQPSSPESASGLLSDLPPESSSSSPDTQSGKSGSDLPPKST